MLRFIVKRLLMLIPILIGVSMIVFILMQLTPGNPAQIMLGPQATHQDVLNMDIQLGLNQPLYIQYLKFLYGLITLNFGTSIQTGVPVLTGILQHFPKTAELTGAAMLIAIVIGIPVGIISSTRQYSFFDNVGTVGGLIGFSMPNFWSSLMLILVFAVIIPIFPVAGYGGIKFLVLPAISLGLQTVAVIARMTRSSMLDVIRQDYIRTARSKGAKESTIILKHALRNALIPIVTVVGLQVGALLEGAILTEIVFSWPGIGQYMVDAIQSKDYPVVQGSIVFVAVIFVLVTLTVDVLYAYIDPRIKSQYK